MKFEWRKHEKALYGAKSMPALVDIPTQNYITQLSHQHSWLNA